MHICNIHHLILTKDMFINIFILIKISIYSLNSECQSAQLFFGQRESTENNVDLHCFRCWKANVPAELNNYLFRHLPFG